MYNSLQSCSCCLMYRSIQPAVIVTHFKILQSCVQQFTVLQFTAVYSDLQQFTVLWFKAVFSDLQQFTVLWFTAWVPCDTDQVDLVAAVFEDGNGLLVVHILQRDPINTHHSIIYPVMYNDKHQTYLIQETKEASSHTLSNTCSTRNSTF